MLVDLATIEAKLGAALAARSPVLPAYAAEGTTAYRLLHGATEGLPGCTLDRYGDLLLWQTFRDPPDVPPDVLLPRLQELVGEAHDDACIYGAKSRLQIMWSDRRRNRAETPPPPELPAGHAAMELGLKYLIRPPEPGRDPGLFLDFRAARRWLRTNAEGRDVLNTFSYTCGASVAALAGGANEVVSLDFSDTALEVGISNACANELPLDRFTTIRADALPALRQLAGLPMNRDRRRGGQRGSSRGGGGRGGRGGGGGGSSGGSSGGSGIRQPKLRARQFDVVVLDPPTWAVTAYGAVDLVRDYQSLFKPALLATAEGGKLLATNHVSTVEIEGWLESLDRCATKAGRPLAGLEVLAPEEDFPSPDGRHPLKMAIATVAEAPLMPAPPTAAAVGKA